MQHSQANLLLRDDTFLGVCEGLGQDFGFNPLWLRLTFAALLLFNPTGVIGAYLGIGLIVALSRMIYPNAPGAGGGGGADPRDRRGGRTQPV